MLRLLAPILCFTVLAGCGSANDVPTGAATPIDFLPGDRVGELAEKQLEAEHLKIAVGKVTCPDLDWHLNASVRCVKVSELSDGRRVKIPGTVTVTSTENGGKLHVALDDRATEFGVDAGHLTDDVKDWVGSQVGSPTAVSCPYLTGVVGTVVGCAVTLGDAQRGDEQRVVLATVTTVEPDDYRTRYVLSWKD